MKKLMKSLMVALVGVFALSSCEDVPAPYTIPGTGGNESGETPSPASIEVTCAEALALVNQLTDGSSSTESYAITGYITEVPFSVSNGQQTFWMADTKDGGKVFEAYYAKLPEGVSAFTVGTKVKITGKLTKFIDKSGKVIPEINKPDVEILEDEGGTNPPTPTGENLLTNGDFEAWTEGQPDNWKSASSAGNATLSQSEDAHGGSYAVAIAAPNTTGNKRMAYKELTLKAGTYKFSIYAKSTTEDKSQTEVGYVPVNNGTAEGYKYGGYVSLNNTEWTEVSTTFTLESKTTVCLVVMNPKTTEYATAQTILVDDATLVTSDGGIAEGGEDQTDTPTEGTAYTLATSISDGTYLIAANTSDNTYKLATDLGSKTYGYLSGTNATAAENVITTNAATAEWTITVVDGGYTIQDSNSRYLYMTGTYNSFNVDATQKEGYIWSISIANDGTATITNNEKGKTIQWSTQYNSYGCYSTESGIKPQLFRK